MTAAPIKLSELEKGLACTILKPGVAMPSCHDYSVCDCVVMNLIAALRDATETLALVQVSDGVAHFDKWGRMIYYESELEIISKALARIHQEVDFT